MKDGVPSVPYLPGGFSESSSGKWWHHPRTLKKVFIAAVLVILSPFLYQAFIGMFDLQVVSSVDDVAIRYKHIAVSLSAASELIQRNGQNPATQMKRRELELGNLATVESKILRVQMVWSGDTAHATMTDEELSAWGRQTGRIKRARAWEGNSP